VVGLSLGGLTSTLVTFHPRLRDPRIAVAVSIAGPSSLFNSRFYQSTSVPFLMVAADTDAIVDYHANAEATRERDPAATVVTLHHGSHTGFAGPAALLFRWHDNPDSVGCKQITGNLPKKLDATGALGGEELGIIPPDPRPPCHEPTLPHAIRPARQHALTTLAVTSFLERYLNPDPEARRGSEAFLWQTLARENPEVRVDPPRQQAASAPSDSSSARQQAASAPSDSSSARQQAASAPSDSSSARQQAASAPSDSSSARQQAASAPSDPASARQQAASAPSDPASAPLSR
jgi:hypothetical protein